MLANIALDQTAHDTARRWSARGVSRAPASPQIMNAFVESIETQSSAKQFFVSKVLVEAQAQGIELSQAEKTMLRWSESDPEFKAEPALVEQLTAEIPDDEYEAKIRNLLASAYHRDLKADASAKRMWRQAYSVLNRGDHYILVMINQAIGRKLRPWWKFSIA